jgi:L-histidine Nalpha-methyltransferase
MQSSIEPFRTEVLDGLRNRPRTLPCKYFYDEAGAALFDQICQLEEYPLTRTELGIMRQHASEMADLLGPRCLLIEYGSGSGTKTELLLEQMVDPAGYVPVDLSQSFLDRTAATLSMRFPKLATTPLHADFTRPIILPLQASGARRVVYFPGSTIGNFTPDEAVALFRQTATLCGHGGAMLLGADLKKDPALLHAAYNDHAGVTAAFNLNLLTRISRELGADFQPDRFWHYAFYQPIDGRMEMHLVSRCRQKVHVAGHEFDFAEGESIRTEYSYKYSADDLRRLAEAGGFRLVRLWTDGKRTFGVGYLVCDPV